MRDSKLELFVITCALVWTVCALLASYALSEDLPPGAYLRIDSTDIYVVSPYEPPEPNEPIPPIPEPNEPTEPPTLPPIGDIKSCADIEGPCVEYHAGDNWKTTMQSVPTSGGTMLVMPGEHEVSTVPWLANRKSITIIGLESESSAKPHVFAGATRLNAFVPWGATNGDLTVRNIKFSNGGNCIYSGSKTKAQTIRLTDVDLHNCGHGLMGAFEYHKQTPETAVFDDRYYLHNVECAYSGTHCIYIDRSLYAELIGGRYYAAGFHAIKLISKTIKVQGVTTSNVELDGSLTFPPRKAGAANMSLVGCQWGEVTDNDIIFHYRPETGGNIITRQPRHDIKGCDHPPYTGTEFWTKEYWDDPHDFLMKVRGNRIKLLGDREQQTVLNLLLLNPTAPVEPVVAGNTKLKYILRPEWWVERSRTQVYDNDIEGMNPQDNICLSRAWGNMAPGNEPPFFEMCEEQQ